MIRLFCQVIQESTLNLQVSDRMSGRCFAVMTINAQVNGSNCSLHPSRCIIQTNWVPDLTGAVLRVLEFSLTATHELSLWAMHSFEAHPSTPSRHIHHTNTRDICVDKK